MSENNPSLLRTVATSIPNPSITPAPANDGNGGADAPVATEPATPPNPTPTDQPVTEPVVQPTPTAQPQPDKTTTSKPKEGFYKTAEKYANLTIRWGIVLVLIALSINLIREHAGKKKAAAPSK